MTSNDPQGSGTAGWWAIAIFIIGFWALVGFVVEKVAGSHVNPWIVFIWHIIKQIFNIK